MEYEHTQPEREVYRTGNYVSPYREKNTARNSAPVKKSTDCTSKVTLVQIVVFTIIALAVFGLFKTQNPAFAQMQSAYKKLMQRDMTAKEIGEAVKTAVSVIVKPHTDASDEGGTENTSETVSELPTDITASGGEDLMTAGSNKTFAPFYLSEPIVVPLDEFRITSRFGYRVNPVTNEYGFHSGLDMAAPEGTSVKAAFDGTVKKIDCTSGRGNYLVLSSANGVETVYCHCSEIIAEQDANIKAGEIIAKVGSTGMSTGPHLHFEIIINGVYCNPEWVVKK